MLGTRMSNQDEDEVEDELDALEQEVNGTKIPSVNDLPEAPNATLPEPGGLRSQTEQERARERARRRKEAAEAAEPTLA